MFECKMSLQYAPDFNRFVFAQGSGPDSPPKLFTSCTYEVRASSLISLIDSPACSPTASSSARCACRRGQSPRPPNGGQSTASVVGRCERRCFSSTRGVRILVEPLPLRSALPRSSLSNRVLLSAVPCVCCAAHG